MPKNTNKTNSKSPTSNKSKAPSKRKNIQVTQESESGRNNTFYDPDTKKTLSRSDFVKEIKQGKHPGYHLRNIDGIETPASNPDKSENNNLD